jgi:hypothetical protein
VGLIVGLIVGSLASPLPTRRKATKGGLPNVLFIQAAVEDLPSGGLLEVVIGVDPERDRTEMERLGLRPLTLEYVEKILTPLYSSAGFE